MKRTLLVLVLLFALMISGCNSNADDVSREPMTSDEIDQMYTDPDKFKGRMIEITGQIFTDPDYDESIVFFQMNTDIENFDRNTLVTYDMTNFKVSNNDYVKVTGTIAGSEKYETMIGTTISAPLISASKVEIISYADAVSPTTQTVIPESSSIDQHGYVITVDKVEFSESETRVYVTITNNGSAKFTAYSFNSKLTQNGQQYAEEDNYEADYQQVETDILPGNTTSGVFTYPAVEVADLQVYIEGSSDDWEEDFNPYTFDIAIQ